MAHLERADLLRLCDGILIHGYGKEGSGSIGEVFDSATFDYAVMAYDYANLTALLKELPAGHIRAPEHRDHARFLRDIGTAIASAQSRGLPFFVPAYLGAVPEFLEACKAWELPVVRDFAGFPVAPFHVEAAQYLVLSNLRFKRLPAEFV